VTIIAGTPDFDFKDLSNNDTTKKVQTKISVLPVLTVHLQTEGHNGANRSARSNVNLSYHAVFIGIHAQS
jgi:hypothetical protein